MDENLLLMIPGPTFLHPRVLRAMAKPLMPHRDQWFADMFIEQAERMKTVFQTKNDLFILSGSGTSSMDAAVSNIMRPGDKILCLVSGKFSERFVEIVEGHGGTPVVLNFEWGTPIDMDTVQEALTPDIRAVTMVHNESSTGVRNDVASVTKMVRDTDALMIVDCISSMAGDDIRVDEWGIDLCITGSQKCLALPPGLSFLSVSEKAWDVIDERPGYCYYLNVKNYKENKYLAPYTQSITLTYALKESLDIIFEEGLNPRIERHKYLAELTRSGVKELGLQLLPTPEDICSRTVTAFYAPSHISEAEIRNTLKNKYNIIIAGGQAHLKGKIMRIGHMGNCQEKDILCTLSCLEKILK
ncbi:MAG: alanine--glyoxylate aminotransferase family protein [Theionarchaea archaeon]|nr:alanine--glyoxylate aminotransferase family protein [Theionarchaea archaeon]